MQGQAGDAWALDEAVVFGRYDLFAKRCRKLVSLFTTIHQFSQLAQARSLHLARCACLQDVGGATSQLVSASMQGKLACAEL